MVLSCEDELPEILELVNLVNFREAMSEKGDDYDIAFIEGSVTRNEEIKKLKRIRYTARVVVSFGACSSIGGLNCLKNRFPVEEVKKLVYGRASGHRNFSTLPVRPIDSIIKVDYYIHGCPPPKEEFLTVFKGLLMGKVPEIANYPVCVDCKMAGNICVFEKGMSCLGPVTRAGCNAICVTYGCICWGCRGLVDDPNIGAHEDTLKRYGLNVEEVVKKFDLYGGYRVHKS